MHRALSDLAGYLDDPARRRGTKAQPNATVLGGDFNCSTGWDTRQGNPSHDLVFSRVAGYGLDPVFPPLPDNSHETMVRPRVPFRQLDYLYTTPSATVRDRGILHTPELEARKDHLPVWANVAL
jgi:endonuclease/exonuclease/phosphatase family metal-dependent hydrolase